MKRQESREDYLETILVLQQRGGGVRAVDVAAHLGFSKPSVSVAMKHLRQAGLVETRDDGSLTLTEVGQAIAARVYERHNVLTEALVLLGVSEQTAKEDACRMEHDISEETFFGLKAYIARQRGSAAP